MKTVLFATDHMPPDPKALDYAMVLCDRLAARLEVLHILQSSVAGDNNGRLRRYAMRTARQIIKPDRGNKTLLPEPGGPLSTKAVNHLQRLHSAHPTTHIDYCCEITGETTGATIERYVRSHRDIILTVFDSRSDRQLADIKSKSRRPAKKNTMPKLTVPLVLMKKKS